MMNKYEIIIYWSDEDQSYIADVPFYIPDQKIAISDWRNSYFSWILEWISIFYGKANFKKVIKI